MVRDGRPSTGLPGRMRRLTQSAGGAALLPVGGVGSRPRPRTGEDGLDSKGTTQSGDKFFFVSEIKGLFAVWKISFDRADGPEKARCSGEGADFGPILPGFSAFRRGFGRRQAESFRVVSASFRKFPAQGKGGQVRAAGRSARVKSID